jgi:tRNA(Ile)-lysidine synthase
LNRYQGIESWAREQRYAIFGQIVKKNEALLMAHHANDQAETFLWHAMRGAGLDGLSGIPQVRRVGQGVLVRPLLSLSQSFIGDYQKEAGLLFSQDPSNADTSMTRNKIRHHVIPDLERSWPHLVKSLSQNTQVLAEQKQLLEKYLMPIFFGLFDEYALSIQIDRLLRYDKSEQAWFIRYWLMSFNLPVLSFETMQELLRQLKTDNQLAFSFKCNEKTISIRRYQNQLYLARSLPSISMNQAWDWQQQPFKFHSVDIGANDLFSKQSLHNLKQKPIDVCFAQSGKSIKKYWQSHRVPPWCRVLLPIFYQDNHRLKGVNYLAMFGLLHYRRHHCGG